jgi:hypothetical protein
MSFFVYELYVSSSVKRFHKLCLRFIKGFRNFCHKSHRANLTFYQRLGNHDPLAAPPSSLSLRSASCCVTMGFCIAAM